MSSTIISIRLTQEELTMLDHYVNGAAGYTSRAEYIRALLWREYDKRHNTKTPRRMFDSEWRNGRPRRKP